MAYKEKYPLDITPQGDTVQDSIKKNRDELLNVAQQMELKASGGGGTGGGGASGGLRNRLLSGKVSNGEFSFLTGDNLSVMIDGSQTPVLLSFADGFNDYGAVDYITTINRKQSAWSLPANSTSYLYVERSASGGLPMAVQRLNQCASLMRQQLQRIKCTTIQQAKKCMYTPAHIGKLYCGWL